MFNTSLISEHTFCRYFGALGFRLCCSGGRLFHFTVFWEVSVPFKGVQKSEQIITLKSISAAGLHDRREKIVSRGHLVYRQKASTEEMHVNGEPCNLNTVICANS